MVGDAWHDGGHRILHHAQRGRPTTSRRRKLHEDRQRPGLQPGVIHLAGLGRSGAGADRRANAAGSRSCQIQPWPGGGTAKAARQGARGPLAAGGTSARQRSRAAAASKNGDSAGCCDPDRGLFRVCRSWRCMLDEAGAEEKVGPTVGSDEGKMEMMGRQDLRAEQLRATKRYFDSQTSRTHEPL